MNVHTKWENDEDEQQMVAFVKHQMFAVAFCSVTSWIIRQAVRLWDRHLLVLVFEKTQHQNDTFLFLALFNRANVVFREHRRHITYESLSTLQKIIYWLI